MNQSEYRAYIVAAYPELLDNYERIKDSLSECEIFQKESMAATIQLLQIIAQTNRKKPIL